MTGVQTCALPISRTQAPKPSLGLSVQDIPKDLEALVGVARKEGALVVDVIPGSPAHDSGFMPGDVILRANDHSISGAKDFEKFSKGLGKKELAVVYVQRGPGEKVFLSIRKS